MNNVEILYEVALNNKDLLWRVFYDIDFSAELKNRKIKMERKRVPK